MLGCIRGYSNPRSQEQSRSVSVESMPSRQKLRGKFKFVGDETAVQQLLVDGIPAQYARDYIVAGCLYLLFPPVPTIWGETSLMAR